MTTMTDADLMEEMDQVAEQQTEIPLPDAPKRRRGPGRPRAGTAPAGPAGTAPPADRPPRSRTPRAKRAAAKVDANTVRQTVAALHAFGGMAGLPRIGMPQTGAVLAERADAAGEVWAKLAERYPLIARLFSASGDGMLFVELAMVYAPIVQTALAERAAIGQARAAAAADMAGPISTTPVDYPAAGTPGPPF